MRIFISYIIILLISISGPLQARNSILLPQPQHYTPTETSFKARNISIVANEQTRALITDFLNDLPVRILPDSRHQIEVILQDSLSGIQINPEEAYQLQVSSKKITIRAVTKKGVFWAMQTLRQLTERNENHYKIQGCEITDWPAFRIRGFMQDVGRSYISIEELKREIEVLSRYKMNVFHWHLT